MFQYLSQLPNVLRVLSPAAVAFLTPNRAFGLLGVLAEIGQAITARLQNASLEIQAKETREALEAPIDLFFHEFQGFEDEKEEVKKCLIPWFMALIYGSPDPLAQPETDEQEGV